MQAVYEEVGETRYYVVIVQIPMHAGYGTSCQYSGCKLSKQISIRNHMSTPGK